MQFGYDLGVCMANATHMTQCDSLGTSLDHGYAFRRLPQIVASPKLTAVAKNVRVACIVVDNHHQTSTRKGRLQTRNSW